MFEVDKFCPLKSFENITHMNRDSYKSLKKYTQLLRSQESPFAGQFYLPFINAYFSMSEGYLDI